MYLRVTGIRFELFWYSFAYEAFSLSLCLNLRQFFEPKTMRISLFIWWRRSTSHIRCRSADTSIYTCIYIPLRNSAAIVIAAFLVDEAVFNILFGFLKILFQFLLLRFAYPLRMASCHEFVIERFIYCKSNTEFMKSLLSS